MDHLHVTQKDSHTKTLVQCGVQHFHPHIVMRLTGFVIQFILFVQFLVVSWMKVVIKAIRITEKIIRIMAKQGFHTAVSKIMKHQ